MFGREQSAEANYLEIKETGTPTKCTNQSDITRYNYFIKYCYNSENCRIDN